MSSRLLRMGLALALLLEWAAVPVGAAADDTTDKVDRIFAAWDTTATPGAALAVVRDGKIIYERGYGMASLEDGLVMTPSKVFDIGSVSKQFTAACVALLVAEGKIGLEDDVRKYIPEMPAAERPVTVNHLLHHTSGLRDYNALLELSGFRSDADCPTVEEALRVICLQKKLNYTPGREYSYTNSGFFLLSQIVERVSGRSLNAFARERIFGPLGMKSTLYQDDHNQIIKNRARGYDRTEKGFRINMSAWDETGDGNVYTTVEDLFLWDQAFYSNALGRSVMDMMHTCGVLNDGKPIDYAWGLVIGEYKGLKTVEHGGAWAGFRANIVRFPEEKFSVICLANLGDMDPEDLSHKVADIYLAGKTKEAPKADKAKIKPEALPRKALEEKAGNYQDRKAGLWAVVAIKEGRLQIGLGGMSVSFVPLDPNIFVATDVFKPAAAGGPAGLELSVRGEDRYAFEKAEPLGALTEADLARYAGDYVSEELMGAVYRLVLDKGALRVEFRNPIAGEPLKAMAPDKFAAGGVNLDFIRSGKEITGFGLSVGRASDIRFVRK